MFVFLRVGVESYINVGVVMDRMDKVVEDTKCSAAERKRKLEQLQEELSDIECEPACCGIAAVADDGGESAGGASAGETFPVGYAVPVNVVAAAVPQVVAAVPSVDLKYIFTDICTNKNKARATITARIVLNKIRLYVLENLQHFQALPSINVLLNSDMITWGVSAIGHVTAVPIPVINLGDYQKKWSVVGLGTTVNQLVTNPDIDITKKSVMIRGWQEICKMKSRGVSIELIHTPTSGLDKTTDVIIGILEKVRTGRPNSMIIDNDEIRTLNGAIPWGSEITDYPLLLYIKEMIMKSASVADKTAILDLFKETLVTNFPGWILSNKEDGATALCSEISQLIINPSNSLYCNSETVLYHTKCNVGCVQFAHESLKTLTNGGHHLYIGSIFMRIKKYKYNALFNRNVISWFLKDFYKQVEAAYDRNSGTILVTRDGIDSFSVLPKIKTFVDITGIGHTNQQIQDFVEGCVILNLFSDVLAFSTANIPASIREYLGDTLDNRVPGAVAAAALLRADSRTDELYAEFESMYTGNIFRLNTSDFKRRGGTQVFSGRSEDIAVYERYDKFDFYTVPCHLPGAFIRSIVDVLGEDGVGSVIVGGMANMLRYNPMTPRLTRDVCDGFIHCCSTVLDPKEHDAFWRYYGWRCASVIDVINFKTWQRTNGFAVISNLQGEYSRALGGDVNFQAQVNAAFADLRAGSCRSAL